MSATFSPREEVRCKCGHIRHFRFSDGLPQLIRDRVKERACKQKCMACDSALADSMGLLPGDARIETSVCIVDIRGRTPVLVKLEVSDERER